jgi:pSer/pThr/pTyr-binding forkhead associated (FHA) protein
MNNDQSIQLEVEMLTKPSQRYLLKFDHFPILIGRNPHAEIFIPHKSISLRHLQLIIDQGQVCAVDLSSSKGTFFENQALTPFKPIALQVGDFLTLAKICRLKILPNLDQMITSLDQEIPQRSFPITQETLQADDGFEGWVLSIKNTLMIDDHQTFYVPYDSEISLCLLPQSISLLSAEIQEQKHEKIELKASSKNLQLSFLSTQIKINQQVLQTQQNPQSLQDGDLIEWGHFLIQITHYHALQKNLKIQNHLLLLIAFAFSLLLFLYTCLKFFLF